MDLVSIHTVAMIAPITCVALLMATGNYRDANRPILSSTMWTIYLLIANVLGALGIAGAFGVFNTVIESFDKLWGFYLFSSILFQAHLHQIRNKCVDSQERR